MTENVENPTLPEPMTRADQYLASIAGEEVELPAAPISRLEHYLAYIAGQDVELPAAPRSRLEKYLAYIAENGLGGDPAPVEIEEQ